MTDGSNMTDLWERMRQGDIEAMILLYKQSYGGLLSYGVQLSNCNETAKDAINDVFLNIWENRSKLKSVGNVKAYLFACIRRKVFQSATLNGKVSSIPADELLFNQATDLSQEEILVAIQQSDEIRLKVQKALEKLTNRQRELIQMKYFKGLDYRQIEIETGISMKTAYNTIYNAMKILTNELRNVLFAMILFAIFG